ncbi:RHS repeat domain-containing protein, partial [Dokdonella immobilis]
MRHPASALGALCREALVEVDPDHAQVDYGYDVQDNLSRVTDPRNLVTRYLYTGFDELETLTSPDTGL